MDFIDAAREELDKCDMPYIIIQGAGNATYTCVEVGSGDDGIFNTEMMIEELRSLADIMEEEMNGEEDDGEEEEG
jgi:hypothetical protein